MSNSKDQTQRLELPYALLIMYIYARTISRCRLAGAGDRLCKFAAHYFHIPLKVKTSYGHAIAL